MNDQTLRPEIGVYVVGECKHSIRGRASRRSVLFNFQYVISAQDILSVRTCIPNWE